MLKIKKIFNKNTFRRRNLYVFLYSISLCLLMFTVKGAARSQLIYGLKIDIFPFDQVIPNSEEALLEYALKNGLDECHEFTCPLTRGGSTHAYRNPQVAYSRSLFENYVTEKVACVKKHSETVVFTDFGSGRLMQDLFLLWKLYRRGFTNFIFNFIDSVYESNINEIVSDEKAHRRNDKIVVIHPFVDKGTLKHSWLVRMAKAFGFKDLCIQLFFFSSAENYLHACHLNFNLKLDFLISVDTVLGITQENSFISEIVEIFKYAKTEDAKFYLLCSSRHRLLPYMLIGRKTKDHFAQQFIIDELILTPCTLTCQAVKIPTFKQDYKSPTTTFEILQKAFDMYKKQSL